MKRLEVALSKGDEKQVLAAVSNGADPNSVCRGGVIALHHAVEGGDIELITLLVQAGADVNMKVASHVLVLDFNTLTKCNVCSRRAHIIKGKGCHCRAPRVCTRTAVWRPWALLYPPVNCWGQHR